MKNYIQPGESITIPAPAATDSGDVVVAGGLVGVAVHDAGSGDDLTITTQGVFELPKTSAQAWTLGATIYATSAGVTTTASSGNTRIGLAAAVADNPSDTGMVLLNAGF